MNDNKAKRFVGENAWDKVVRLLKEFNDTSISSGYVDLRLEKEGCGSLVLLRDKESGEQTIVSFNNLAELIGFFESDTVGKILHAINAK